MVTDLQSIVGLLAGILMLASYIFYIAVILKGTTRPNRATWFMLAAVSMVIVASYKDLGAGNTLWIAMGAAVGTVIVALLSIRLGSGGRSLLDRVCILVGIASIIAYFVIDDPFLVFMVSLVIDFVAILPTIQHARLKPREEDIVAWSLTLVADILAIVAIEHWTFDIAVYPLYMFILNGLIVFFLYRHFLKTKKLI